MAFKDKSPAMKTFLEKLVPDAERKIEEKICVGCGKPAKEFRDEISRKEQTITGYCQECQDAIFHNQ